MSTMSVPGFTAEAALPMHGGPGWMVAVKNRWEMASQVVPQLSVSLGCRAFDVCYTNCCTLSIEYVGPYHMPLVTVNCHTRGTCGFGGLFSTG